MYPNKTDLPLSVCLSVCLSVNDSNISISLSILIHFIFYINSQFLSSENTKLFLYLIITLFRIFSRDSLRLFTWIYKICISFYFWYNEDTKRSEQQLDSDVDRCKDGGLFTVYITPLTLPKLERCYFFVFISINLTTSDTNATSKVAKEHTNVNAS